MKKIIHFTKMHGLGNDFVVIDGINQRLDSISFSTFSQFVCGRNFGIGADGVVLVEKSEKADIKMTVYNSDGTIPEMCGNAIRCFAQFVYENDLIEKEVFSVETGSGIIVPGLIIKDGHIQEIEVDMGPPILETDNINRPISVCDQSFVYTAVSMGNPHAVVFADDLTAIDIVTIGPAFETHPQFPQKTNTEFVQIISPQEAIVIVWERGVGETLACGTGACATLVAGVLNKKLDRKAIIHLPGGDLKIEWQKTDDHIIMTGPATTVFKGEISI